MRPLPPQLGPALGALARGQTAGGRADGWTDGSVAGRTSSWCLRWLRCWSKAGTRARQDSSTRGPLRRGQAETWHHGPASVLPPTPRPLVLAPAAVCFCFRPGPNPPRGTIWTWRRRHPIPGWGLQHPPGDIGTLPWPGPTSLQARWQDALILFSVSMATASFPSPFRQLGPLFRPPAAPSPASTHRPPRTRGTQAATQHGPLLQGLSGAAMPPAQHPWARTQPCSHPVPTATPVGDFGRAAGRAGTGLGAGVGDTSPSRPLSDTGNN